MDERFTGRDYRMLFPREWNDAAVCILENVEQQLGAFWKMEEKNKLVERRCRESDKICLA